MNPGPNGPSSAHFHIRWRRPSTSDGWHTLDGLDWEIFPTLEEAESRATELARPGEKFVIDQFDDACPKCARLKEIARESAAGRSE